jgi:hypothetical protein
MKPPARAAGPEQTQASSGRTKMIGRTTIACCAWALLLGAAPPAARADGPSSVQSTCAARTKGPYGFQCQGQAQVLPGLGLEPVTLVGTVAGSSTGVFDGRGTFSSSLGSARQHLVGQAQFQDRTCFGHIRYRVWLMLPDGSDGLELPPLDIDFATVAGGFEILGTPNALAGVSGADVPRLSCRLVRVRADD